MCDHLVAIIGPERVFMDVEDIVPGQHFADTIDRSMAACQTVLIVIGPKWIETLRERFQSGETDYVFHEVSSALSHKLKIVPVLVGGAVMPRQTDMPPALSTLPFHQAAQLHDNAFKQDCERLARNLGLAASPKSARKKWLAALAAAAIGIALVVSNFRAPAPVPADPRLATARTQTELGEHQSAFRTYGEILKTQPASANVADLQADAAMAWLRDFQVTVGEGQKAEDIAGPPLAEIIGALEAALARTTGSRARAGDVLAHLGWAHWLNQRVAHREFGPAAEQALKKALAADPENVFGHAMLGAWLLQTNGDAEEALRHFEIAEKTKQQRPFLRRLQLGGMLYNTKPGMPASVMRLLNRMRIDGEPIGERPRSRAMTYFRPGNLEDQREMLSAVSPADARATYLWLDSPTPGDENKYEGFRRELILGRLLELEGKTAEALVAFTELERRLRVAGYIGSLLDEVSATAKRLRAGNVKPF